MEKIEALLSLRGRAKTPIGRDRIALLLAVGTEGSITGAAKAVGLSYKAAWDAINAMNNLLPRPVVIGQTGGRQGGGAILTPEGHSLISAFTALETKIARFAETFAAEMADPAHGTASAVSHTDLFWSLAMKTSARNALRCVVTEVKPGAVNSEVIMRLGDRATLIAIITHESQRELEIEVGREVVALIKSSFVILAPAEGLGRTSARNQISGTITRVEDGAVNSEVTLDIGGGKSIIAIITSESVKHLGFKEGDKAVALIKSSHVILAVD